MQKTPTTQSQPDHKNGHKPEPVVLPEQASAFAGVVDLAAGILGASGNGNVKSLAMRFDSLPLHTIQRQLMARQLTRSCGNRNVQNWIQCQRDNSASSQRANQTFHHQINPVPVGRVQRFISSEHLSLGDVTGDTIPAGSLFPDSPELSYGEIVALSGDLYGSFEHLASPYYIRKDGQEDRSPDGQRRKIEELNELKNLLRIETRLIAQHSEQAAQSGQSPHGFVPPGIDTGYVTDPSTGTEVPGYELATEGRYGALALENFLHFSFGEENLTAWKSGHRQALMDAFLAGFQGNQSGIFLALARNAAAAHYLTDAFSSGHMRVPRRCADEYYRRLMAGATDGAVEELVNALPERINFEIPLSAIEDLLPSWLPDIDLPDLEVHIPLPLQRWARQLAGALADEIRPFMEDTVGQLLGGLVSKWLHDKENERGLCVSNMAGGRWQAFGDAFLDQPGAGTACGGNTTNRAEAQKAVLADRDEVRRMFDAGQAASQNTYQPGSSPIIYFGFDQPKVNGDMGAIDGTGSQSLDMLATYLQSVNGLTVSLRGWADSRGSEEYNIGLSSRRISAVSAYLTSRGVPAGMFGPPDPVGEPLVPTSAANHHLFRRVEVLIDGTPTPKTTVGNNGLPPHVPLPPEIEGPYGAEEFLPHVESNNEPLEPYEWCDITNPDLKTQVTEKGREMLSGVLHGKATQFIYDKLSDFGPYEVNIDVPYLGSYTIEIPRIPIPGVIADAVQAPIEAAIDHVVTDSVFTGLLDGACTLASSAPASPSGDQCASGP